MFADWKKNVQILVPKQTEIKDNVINAKSDCLAYIEAVIGERILMTYAKTKVARKPKRSFNLVRILDFYFTDSSTSILFYANRKESTQTARMRRLI